jgi:hypothetical protein
MCNMLAEPLLQTPVTDFLTRVAHYFAVTDRIVLFDIIVLDVCMLYDLYGLTFEPACDDAMRFYETSGQVYVSRHDRIFLFSVPVWRTERSSRLCQVLLLSLPWRAEIVGFG